MSQLRGRRSIKGGKSSVKECHRRSLPLLVSFVFFFREFFSRALLSERLEQAIHYPVAPALPIYEFRAVQILFYRGGKIFGWVKKKLGRDRQCSVNQGRILSVH